MNAAPVNVNVGARTAAGASVTLTARGRELHVGRQHDRHRQPVLDGSGGRICRWNGGRDRRRPSARGRARELRTSAQTYSLLNSWAYVPGTYTTTLNYTLTVP